MKKVISKNDVFYFSLAILTFLIWLSKDLSPILAFIIFPLLFLYFLIQQDIKKLIGIILFANMAISVKTGIFKLEYILILFLLGYILLNIIKEKTIAIGQVLVPLIIYFFYNVISLIWTPVLLDGYKGLVGILEGYLVYFIITNSKLKLNKNDFNTFSKVASFLLFTLSLEIFVVYCENGIMNVLTEKDYIHLGWSFSNLLAVIYVFLIPIMLMKYREFCEHKWFIPIDVIAIIGLFLTLSRGAYLGVAVSLVILIILRRKEFLKLGAFLMIVAIITIILLKVFDNNILSRIIERLFSESGRLELYELAWKTFLERPIIGQGIKSSKYLIREILDSPSIYYHNFILQILASLGIIGFLIFAFIVRGWVKVLFTKDAFVNFALASIVGALTHQLFDVSFDLHFFGVYFYLIIGISEIYRHYHGQKLISEYNWIEKSINN